jgi:tetratricopeptide (TPR) repeat protein
MIDPVAARDFFISYTSADLAWAEWIAWELEDVGHTTLIQAWDFRPGMNFVTEMQKGATESSRILIILSQQFLESGFTQAEWTAAFAKDPTGEHGILIPIRVAQCEPPGLLRARIYVDLVGLSEEDSLRNKLLEGVKQGRAKPATRPPIPTLAKQKPASPAAIHRTIHNLPFLPNPLFTGREADLERLGEHLNKRGEVALTQTVALHGLGGVGKTQLAVEYAWKHLERYEGVLWVRADNPEALDAALAGLAGVLGLPEAAAKEQRIQIDAVLGWLKRHERWLLIADNADTDEAAGAVRKRLAPDLACHVVVTSRLSRWPTNMPHLPVDLLLPKNAIYYLQERVAKEGHYAGDDTAAGKLAEELGYLPLALEQAVAFIIELRWSFDKYREPLRKLLDRHREGATRYPASVAKTWNITLEKLSPLSRGLLRLAAWFAPDAISRGIFSADPTILAEALSQSVEVSDLAIEEALGELDRYSIIRLTAATVSVHRLLQAVEQDSLGEEERKRWLVVAGRLFNVFAPRQSWDVSTWSIWISLAPHADSLLEHTGRYGVDIDMLPIALMADHYGSFLLARAAYAKAESLYQRALAILEKALGPDHPDVAWSLNGLGCLDTDLGRYAEAEALLERARAIREQALDPAHRDLAETLYDLAALYRVQSQYPKAEPLYQRAQAIWEKALGLEHPDVAWSLNGLAGLYAEQGQFARAEPLYQRALAIREKALAQDHPEIATSLNNLAALYWDQGQYARAELLYKRARAIREKTLGRDHPEMATSLNNLAGLYRNLGRFAEAEPLFNEALGIREKALGPDHPDVATSLNNLALLYVDQGQCTKAEPLYQRALANREKALGPEHPAVAAILNNMAELWRAQDEYAKAERFYKRALTIFEKALNQEHPAVATILNNLALLYGKQGQHAQAESFYGRALAIREKALGSDHPDVATCLENYALFLRAMGRSEEAGPLESRAMAIRAKRPN